MILVYKYGLKPPTTGAEAVRRQILLAHRYRNDLTQIERGRRAAIRSALSSYADIQTLESSVAEAAAVMEAARLVIKKARAKDRARVETAEQREALRTARAKHAELRKLLLTRLKALRSDTAIAKAIENINATASDLIRNARGHCGVYWGSYLLVEAAVDAARKLPLFDKDAKPNDPEFERWDGTGSLGVQIQHGLENTAIHGSDSRIRIMTGAGVWRKWDDSRADKWRALWLRIGSHEDRSPEWAVFPVSWHRELPPCRIKSATVTLTRCGPWEEWSLQLTIDTYAEVPRQPRQPTEGRVAVNLGWRKLEDGSLRVAKWRSDQGDFGELVLRPDDLWGFGKVRSLIEIRDKNFNEARDALVTWLAARELPEWMVKRGVHTLSRWQSIERLSAIVRMWKTHRFEGDADAYTAAEAWRYHDHHLWSWQEGQRRRTLARRRDIYRVFAASLSERFRVLVLEDTNYKELARRPKPGDAQSVGNETARTQRHLVAPGDLRLNLRQAFVLRGGVPVNVSAENITRTCYVCGSIEEWDQATELMHTCSGCATLWDQDDNACRNLLLRAPAAILAVTSHATAKPAAGGKFARAKAKKAAAANTNTTPPAE